LYYTKENYNMAYSPEDKAVILEKVFDQLIEGKSLRQIKREDKTMPDLVTILKWFGENEETSNSIARARTLQSEGIFDKIQDITCKMESGELDYNTGKSIIWSLQWQAGKLRPLKYGEASLLKIQGDKENPLETINTVRIELVSVNDDREKHA